MSPPAKNDALHATGGPAPVSEGAEKEPEMNQQNADQCVTTYSRPTACDFPRDTTRHEREPGKTGITLPPP